MIFLGLVLTKNKMILLATTMALVMPMKSMGTGNGPMGIWIPLTGLTIRDEPLRRRGSPLYTNLFSLEALHGEGTEDTYVRRFLSSGCGRPNRSVGLNLIGFVWTVDQDTHHTVTVEFYDREIYRDFHFTDNYLYDKACLSEVIILIEYEKR